MLMMAGWRVKFVPLLFQEIPPKWHLAELPSINWIIKMDAFENEGTMREALKAVSFYSPWNELFRTWKLMLGRLLQGGGFNDFLISPLLGEDSQFDQFQGG